jgi:hypothetical protein
MSLDVTISMILSSRRQVRVISVTLDTLRTLITLVESVHGLMCLVPRVAPLRLALQETTLRCIGLTFPSDWRLGRGVVCGVTAI